MRFRPPGREDAAGLLDFFRSLSDHSLYLRFHGHPSVDERLVEPVLDPDWVERGALIGEKDDEIIAVANYVRLRDAKTAEVAFAVADDLQGRGIATRLLERLAANATAVGIQEFLAEVIRIDCLQTTTSTRVQKEQSMRPDLRQRRGFRLPVEQE